MSHIGNYYIIKQYSTIVEDYSLFFKFAKHNKLWPYLYPLYKEDVFQIIALAALTPGTTREKNNLLQRELYHFYKHVIISRARPKKNQNTKIYKKRNPNYENHCDICGKDKKQYMYKSFIPGKTICRNCRKKLKSA